MIRTLILTAALLTAALPVLAQDGCTGCPDADKAKACETETAKTGTVKAESAWAKQIADLEAKAATGDKGAEAALAAACGDCGTGCKKTMTAKIVKLEAAAAKGDSVAKNKLTRMKWDMVFAAVRTEPLTKQVVFYSKAFDNGCPLSKQSMAILMKETGAKDRAELTAKLTELETKASKGCGECKEKIASMRAKLEPKQAAKRVMLSARAEKLVAAAKSGDKGAQESLAKIAASIESKPESLIADLKAFEAKAANGCQTCVTKLAKVEMAMKAGKSDCADCTDCTDCTGGCDDCGSCDGEKACPSETKPVKQ